MAGKKIIILTGKVQSGKTTTLLNWVNKRHDVAGILTPVKEDRRFFYSITEAKDYRMEAGSDEEYLEVGRFKFSTEQFRVMNKIVLKCLNEPYWKWVIIDEIGPLELNQQRGFWPALRQILNGIFSATVVVVARQTLSGTIRDMFEENGLEVSICSASEFQQFTA